MNKMDVLTKELEVSLGPDTGDLSLRWVQRHEKCFRTTYINCFWLNLTNGNLSIRNRVGIHSGPVTAGMLRGDRPRFQLFGDTVNTAARIEATGSTGRLHCSKETADLLMAGNKGFWLEARSARISAKGKGMCRIVISQGNTMTSSLNQLVHRPFLNRAYR